MVPPAPETKQAKEVFVLYAIVLGMGAVVFVGVEGFILYSIVRYRRRDDRLPTQIHGNNMIELVWTAIPTVIVLIIFVLSTLTLNSIEARSASPGVNVEVNGFQWQWTFRYLDGDANAANDVSITGTLAIPPVMVVPVGEPVHLILRSADVIHAFYVPQFLVKRDVIPVSDERLQHAFALFKERADKEWSLADCLSFDIMRERGIVDALTPDMHFAQAGFAVLMRDG